MEETAMANTTVVIVPVILAGGMGTRLWPLSREHYPKQLMPVTGGEHSLLQLTAMRLSGIPDASRPIVVCNEDHRFMVAAQLQLDSLRPSVILLEPIGRNTAPAAAVAAFEASKDGSDRVLLVMPSDHIVQDHEAFRSAVELGRGLASSGHIVTFGIKPDRAATGYGYIKIGPAMDGDNPQAEDGGGVYRIDEFVEKPDQERASHYLAARNYVWNSGMFMFKSSVYLKELERLSPKMFEACREAYEKARHDLDFLRLDTRSFTSCPSDSIDYAVMERTSTGAVVPIDVGWSDVGSWSSLHELRDRDNQGNVLVGDVVAEDVRNCYLHSTNRLVAALGIDNQVVVETKDAILVAATDRVQDIKLLVSKLRDENREEAVAHCKVYRPWGHYECIDGGDRFHVKRLTVNPGASLSLQLHYHRAEHWVVVKGTARITAGEKVSLLSEDQSTYIPWGTKHRLENPGKIPLELIEIQTGSYLGEDDIKRLEDNYGRS
jgi:mannose-1-phosphate guanylyltransferase/mannose-6-phosphate isomerase